jgi:hypothetical protein
MFDFEIIEDGAGKEVPPCMFRRNGKCLPGEHIHSLKPCVIQGIQSIRRDFGLRASGLVPSVGFRVEETLNRLAHLIEYVQCPMPETGDVSFFWHFFNEFFLFLLKKFFLKYKM